MAQRHASSSSLGAKPQDLRLLCYHMVYLRQALQALGSSNVTVHDCTVESACLYSACTRSSIDAPYRTCYLRKGDVSRTLGIVDDIRTTGKPLLSDPCRRQASKPLP